MTNVFARMGNGGLRLINRVQKGSMVTTKHARTRARPWDQNIVKSLPTQCSFEKACRAVIS